MGKYILIGITGCGKSAIGRRAAETLKMPFFEIAKMAARRLKFKDPKDVFKRYGMERVLNEQYLAAGELAEREGPGIIEIWPENVLIPRFATMIKKVGTVIYIQRDTELVIAMMKKSESRMMLRDNKTGREIDPRILSVTEYAEEASSFEALADLTLENNGSEDEGLEKLVAMIRERESVGENKS